MLYEISSSKLHCGVKGEDFMGENFLQIDKFHNNMLEMDQIKTTKFLPV